MLHFSRGNLLQAEQELAIRSIALPPLGCGQRGLAWQDVRALIETTLGDLSDVEVAVYEPVSRPER